MKKFLKLILFLSFYTQAEEIGSVDTEFQLLGPDHKIIVEAFDDPDIDNVTCYVSRAKRGGLKGFFGVAEDTSDASISCEQVGEILLPDKLKNAKKGEIVFKTKTSLLFKSLQVVRFYDNKRNTLIYLTYSDKLVSGSPKNSISALPIVSFNK